MAEPDKHSYLSEEKTEELIDLYETHEVLWNKNLREYKKKRYRIPAINDMVKKLNVENFGPKEVSRKITALRSKYYQARRQMISNGRYTPLMGWYIKMDKFLRPYIKIKSFNLISGLEEKMKSGIQSSYDINTDSIIMVKPEPTEEQESGSDHDSSEYSDQETNSGVLDGNTSSGDDKDSNEEVNEQLPSTNDNSNKSVPQTLKSISEQLEELKPTENTYDKFGLYIASVLRELPRKKTLTLQPQIVNVITLAIAEELDEKTLPKT